MERLRTRHCRAILWLSKAMKEVTLVGLDIGERVFQFTASISMATLSYRASFIEQGLSAFSINCLLVWLESALAPRPPSTAFSELNSS